MDNYIGKWWGPRTVRPILAIHGWQDNAGTFDRLAPLLVHRNQSVYCIDLPGHGLSSHYPKGQYYYLFWDGVHFIRRIVKYFNWDKVTLMGHSLGSGMSFLYAAIFPNEVDKYISIDLASPCVRPPKAFMSVLGDSVDKFLKCETYSAKKTPQLCYDEALDILHDAHNGSITKESAKVMLIRGTKLVGEGKYVFIRDPRLKVGGLGFMVLDQALEFAGQIKCDVLNIKATPGLRSAPEEYYESVLETIKRSSENFQRHNINGTHHLHLNDPDSIKDIIMEFLE